MKDFYDVIVVGGGSAGENAAGYARAHGLTVALVEGELVGGECSYWACMPSKALLRPGEVLAEARRVPAAAAAVTGGVDVTATFKSRDALISGLDDRHQVAWVEGIGVDLIRGVGRLAGERTVAVEHDDGTHQTLRAERAVVLATGSRALYPPIDGLDTVGALDNRAITTIHRVPARLLVLGGGVVGAEMAQAFKRLGAAEVTIVELFDRLLAIEEPFVGEELAAAFEAEGIRVLTEARTTAAARRDGEVVLILADGAELVGDELLVATGRRPATHDLGLDTVGLAPGEHVDVYDRLRAIGVEGGWLYAVGDVNGRALLTHQGKYQARIVGDILGGVDMQAWADHGAVPRVAFTDPQVAAVGRTERQAHADGIAVRTVTQRLNATAAAALHGKDTPGSAHLVIDDRHDVLVGATFTGPNTGEMLHAATVAIVGRVPLDRLWHAVPAFPTLSEVWLRLLEADRDHDH